MDNRSFVQLVGDFVLILLALVTTGAGKPPGDPPKNLREIKRGALAVMEDIVPHEPAATKMLAKVSSGESRAVWGPIFGDAQLGSLVAVKSTKPADMLGDDADLCLLLWKDGWEFRQWVGTVSSRKANEGLDWAIKRRISRNTYYVLSRLDLYPAGGRDHLSWYCDPKTHFLVRTGWPKNCIPSISVNTITFTRQDKPGYTPDIREIHRFTDEPGKRIAFFTESYGEGHLLRSTISVWDSRLGKWVTWRVWKMSQKYNPGHDVYSLCYSETEREDEPFHEDAMIDLDWGNGDVDHSASEFLLWRLTGLGRNALRGIWDDGKSPGVQMPLSVKVTGLHEAVQRFAWPEDTKPRQ